MRRISIDDFHAELRDQGVSSVTHLAFVCPRCRTVQSAHDLIQAGAGPSFEEVEKFLAFSCIGRWTGGKTPRAEPDGLPCDWTLGGLFSLHELEVEREGEIYRRFEIATPEQARAHEAQQKVAA